ncbi:hypothetical protein AKI39_04240 [Bordetella sp. H567]|uniref:hypothetical protein n=1 Tax=Bordetella sp. H567 TaxID=1697043 RepID=UPI00081CAED4|nr:hypothetical protein [Bordetella sp. H567]AOB30065.1 hypothetical protein AKI39_04240 [Bordetella sp. H567]
MNKLSPEVDRQVRIELLRARAAVEREALVHNVAGLTESLSPAHLVRGLMPRLGASNIPGLAWQAFSLVRRYPVITSSLSTIFLRGKRSRLLKLASAAAVGWQVYRGWQARQGQRYATRAAAVTSPIPPTSRPPSV